MLQRCHIARDMLFLGLLFGSAAFAQDSDGFSWKMGPVDVNPGQIAKLIFANPFCPNPLMKLDVTLAITDLTGQIVQVHPADSQPTPAKKRAIVNCNESIQLEIDGEQISPSGTIVGILEVIPDISGIPWVPVNVPLASLQVGYSVAPGFPSRRLAVNGQRQDLKPTFQPTIVIIPIEPVRRLILP